MMSCRKPPLLPLVPGSAGGSGHKAWLVGTVEPSGSVEPGDGGVVVSNSMTTTCSPCAGYEPTTSPDGTHPIRHEPKRRLLQSGEVLYRSDSDERNATTDCGVDDHLVVCAVATSAKYVHRNRDERSQTEEDL